MLSSTAVQGLSVRVAALALLSCLTLPSVGEGRAWEVFQDGSGDAPTIQAGIDSASVGDEVLVHAGTYYESIDFLGKDIVVQSASGPTGTVIDGSRVDDSVVVFVSGEGVNTRLEGFTIQGGTGRWFQDSEFGAGGGILIIDSSPLIKGNVIRDNQVGGVRGLGGGLCMFASRYDIVFPTPRILDNTFERNRSPTNGGGISANDVHSRVEGNTFRVNEAAFDGGAIYVAMAGAGSIEIRNNQFWENLARDHGGAIELGRQGRAAPALVESNLFVRNEAHGTDGSSDLGTGAAISMRGWSGTIRNNTFAKNTGIGRNGCTGGSILLTGGSRTVFVENNLFYASGGCGVVCRSPSGAEGATIRNNLFWENTPEDIVEHYDCSIGTVEGNILDVNPLLCGPEMDNYTVSIESPALAANPPIGVWINPGCGDGVPVESTTWGRIKVRFGKKE